MSNVNQIQYHFMMIAPWRLPNSDQQRKRATTVTSFQSYAPAFTTTHQTTLRRRMNFLFFVTWRCFHVPHFQPKVSNTNIFLWCYNRQSCHFVVGLSGKETLSLHRGTYSKTNKTLILRALSFKLNFHFS